MRSRTRCVPRTVMARDGVWFVARSARVRCVATPTPAWFHLPARRRDIASDARDATGGLSAGVAAGARISASSAAATCSLRGGSVRPKLLFEKSSEQLEDVAIARGHADVFAVELLDQQRKRCDEILVRPRISLLESQAV